MTKSDKKKRRLIKRQAVVEALEDSSENEDEEQKQGKDEHDMDESSIGQMTRWGHLDLG